MSTHRETGPASRWALSCTRLGRRPRIYLVSGFRERGVHAVFLEYNGDAV